MFSALWAGALLLGFSLVLPAMGVALIFLSLNRFLSVIHAWATTFMVLGSSLFAAERRSNPRRYVVIPALIAIFSLLLGLYVAAAQRYPEDGQFSWALWPWGLYLAVFWVGHFWHFGNQDFGVLTLYRNRAGQSRLLDRRADKIYTAAMMYLIQPIVYFSIVKTTAISEIAHTLLPLSFAVMNIAAQIALGAAIFLALAMLAFELSKPARSLPKLLYILVIAVHPTFLYFSVQAGSTTLAAMYALAYLWSHWFIAIGLVARINTSYYRSRGDARSISILRHAALLLMIVGVVFVLTEHYQPYLLFNTDRFYYKELLASISPEQAVVIGLVLGFFLGEQLIHYYCDRCLFRLRSPAVRRSVVPHLLG